MNQRIYKVVIDGVTHLIESSSAAHAVYTASGIKAEVVGTKECIELCKNGIEIIQSHVPREPKDTPVAPV